MDLKNIVKVEETSSVKKVNNYLSEGYELLDFKIFNVKTSMRERKHGKCEYDYETIVKYVLGKIKE